MKKLRLTLIAAVALVLGMGAAALAYATIPDGSGVIHGCRKNSDGQLRVIDSDAGQTCQSGWAPLNWSQTGPQGPEGAPGLSGVHVITELVASETEVLCPEGETAISVTLSQESWKAVPVIGVDGVTPIGYDAGGAASSGVVYLTCAVTS